MLNLVSGVAPPPPLCAYASLFSQVTNFHHKQRARVSVWSSRKRRPESFVSPSDVFVRSLCINTVSPE